MFRCVCVRLAPYKYLRTSSITIITGPAPEQTGSEADYLGVDISSDKFETYSEEEKSEKCESLLNKVDATRNVKIGCERVIPVSFGFIRLDEYNKVRYHGQYQNSEEDEDFDQLDEDILEKISFDNTYISDEIGSEKCKRKVDQSVDGQLVSHLQSSKSGYCGGTGMFSETKFPGDRLDNGDTETTVFNEYSDSNVEPFEVFDNEVNKTGFIDDQYFDTSECSVVNNSEYTNTDSDSLQFSSEHEFSSNFIDESYFGNAQNRSDFHPTDDLNLSDHTESSFDSHTPDEERVFNSSTNLDDYFDKGVLSHDIVRNLKPRPQPEPEHHDDMVDINSRCFIDNENEVGGDRRQSRPSVKQRQSDRISDETVSNPDQVNYSPLSDIDRTNFSETKQQLHHRSDADRKKGELNTQPPDQPQTALHAAREIRSRARLNKTGGNRGKELRSEAEILCGEPASVIIDHLLNSRLHEDDNVVVLNKPFGVPVHGGKAGGWGQCVANLLPSLARRLHCSQLYTVHRLDRDTTGVLLLAKTSEMAKKLQKLFLERAVHKSYWALALNRTGNTQVSENRVEIPLVMRTTDGYERMMPSPVISGSKPARNASLAITRLDVMARAGECLLIRLFPETGARHQVRCHLGLCLDLPVLGDHKYTYWDTVRPQRLGDSVLKGLGLRQSEVRHLPLHLHARGVAVPEIGLRVSAPLPRFFVNNLRRLGITRRR